MILRTHPRLVCSVLLLFLLATLASPIAAVATPEQDAPTSASTPGQNATAADPPPDGDSAPPTNTPVGGIPTSAAHPAAPAAPGGLQLSADVPPDADSAPPTNTPIGGFPPTRATGVSPVLVTGDPNLLLQLQQLMGLNAIGQPAAPSDFAVAQPSTIGFNGSLQNNMSLNATINASPSALPDTHMALQYDGKTSHMQLGDITGTLPGNDLVSLNRAVQGVEFSTALGEGSMTGLISQVVAPTQTDNIAGQNTNGPYYLSGSPIETGSEVATLNGKQLTENQDYTLDDTTGAFTLTMGNILRTTDTLSVTYRVASQGTGNGTLFGFRGAYPVMKGMTLGFSHLQFLAAATSGSGTVPEQDTFTGQNTAGPYYLNNRPVVFNSESVTVGGVTQTQGSAYTLNMSTGALLFATGHFPPSGSAIVVQYAMTPPVQLSGNRSVTGVDMNWKIGGGLGLSLQGATSSASAQPATPVPLPPVNNEALQTNAGVPLIAQVYQLQHAPVVVGSETLQALSLILTRDHDYTIDYQTGQIRLLTNVIPMAPGNPVILVSYTPAQVATTGTGNAAMTATATYQTKKVNALTSYRQTDSGFTPFDAGTPIVNRAMQWSASYMPNTALTLTTTGDNSQLPLVNWPGSQIGATATQQYDRSYTLDFHPKDLPSLVFQQTTAQSSQIGHASVGNNSVSDNLSSTWTLKKMTATVTLNRTTSADTQAASSVSTTGSTPTTAASTFQNTMNSAAFMFGYHPGAHFDLSMNVSTNTLQSNTNAVNAFSHGNNIQANVTYHPKKTLSFNATYQGSNTSAVTDNTGAITSPPQQSSAMSVSSTWQTTHHVHVAVNYTAGKYNNGVVGGSSNNLYEPNTSTALAANVGWKVGNKTTLSGYGARQRYQETGGDAPSSDTMTGAGVKYEASKLTTVSVNVQRLQGATSDGVNQLWQTVGQTQQAQGGTPSEFGAPTLTGTSLTAISGNVVYRLGKKDDFSASGELLNGNGGAGDLHQCALGVGWHYHASDHLTYSVDAHHVQDTGTGNAGVNNDNQLRATLSVKF